MRTGRIPGIALLIVGARSPDTLGFQEVQKAEREISDLLKEPSSDVRSKGEEDAKPHRLEDQAAGSVDDPPCNGTDEEYRCKQIGHDGG